MATLFPFNFVRIFFLNLIPGFKFKDSCVGFLNTFIADEVIIENSKIGNFNRFKVDKINCVNKSIIGSYNKILSNLENLIFQWINHKFQ